MSTPVPSSRRQLLVGGIVAAVLIGIVAVVAGAVWTVRQIAGVPETLSGSTVVTKVVDGDTIEVRGAGHTEKVRLLGIDTPETKDPRKPVQCFGKEASAHTAALLPEGTEVLLRRDVEERDRYDRVLAYVYRVEDGLFVNLDLARGGYADLLTYPPNVAHTADLQAAVSEARREQRGLWKACGGPGRPA